MKKYIKLILLLIEVLAFFFIAYICFALPILEVIQGISVSVIDFNIESLLLKYAGLTKLILCIVFEIMYCKYLWIYNSEKIIFGAGDSYKDYPYCIYYISAKVLGYKYCTLKNVPTWLQFKLILSNCFSHYLTGDNLDEEKNNLTKDSSKPKTVEKNIDSTCNVVNLILVDTYPINMNLLPKDIYDTHYIIIQRSESFDGNRYYNQKFVNQIQKSIYGLSNQIDTINVYATTNPKHNMDIVQNIFSKGNRTHIKHINVAIQTNETWKFEKLKKVK